MNELMHKKLEAELVSLAHSILQMKNKDDVNALHKKAHDIYEKLSVLKFVDSYLQTTPNTTEKKEDIIDRIKEVKEESEDEAVAELLPEEETVELNEDDDSIHDITNEAVEEAADAAPEEAVVAIDEPPIIESTEPVEEEAVSLDFEMTIENDESVDEEIQDEEIEPVSLFQTSLEDEFKDAISADVATELFEKATKDDPVVETDKIEQKRSLNDSLFKNNLQIGLNDRIAFVKNLFDGSQEDFNRVVSQLNSFKTEKEAKTFINKFVKPDYDWTDMGTYEERFIDLIERKFL